VGVCLGSRHILQVPQKELPLVQLDSLRVDVDHHVLPLVEQLLSRHLSHEPRIRKILYKNTHSFTAGIEIDPRTIVQKAILAQREKIYFKKPNWTDITKFLLKSVSF
jgi:hypothetical protein